MELILPKVKDILSQYLSNNKNISFLLALSGGKDSMTLLHILLKLQLQFDFKFCCVYINHNLRDEESLKEELFIRKLRREKKIKIFIKKINPKVWESLHGESVEMAARRIRYKIFKKVIKENNIDYILTAHHYDDKLETFFLQLLRGGGIETLASIPIKNNRIIRPMLFVSRKEIDAYITKNNIDYTEDSTNSKNIYERNKIRNVLFPVLNEIKPNWRKSFEYIFEYFKEENLFFHRLINRILKKITILQHNCVVSINKRVFDKESFFIKKKIVKQILSNLHFPIKPTYSFFKIFDTTDRIQYETKNFTVESKGKYLWFVKKEKVSFSEHIDILPFSFVYEKNKFTLLEISATKNPPNPKECFCFLYDTRLNTRLNTKMNAKTNTKTDIKMFPLTIQNITKDDYDLILNEKRIIDNLKNMGIAKSVYNKVLIIKTQHNCVVGIFYYTFRMVSKEYYIKKDYEEDNHYIMLKEF